jgi:hypothetical protein
MCKDAMPPKIYKNNKNTNILKQKQVNTKIFFYLSTIYEYNNDFNDYIIKKYPFIINTEITHTKSNENGISIRINSILTIIVFNNIINDIITYYKNDPNIIFFYKTGKENTKETGKYYTFSNIIKVKNYQSIQSDIFLSDSD